MTKRERFNIEVLRREKLLREEIIRGLRIISEENPDSCFLLSIDDSLEVVDKMDILSMNASELSFRLSKSHRGGATAILIGPYRGAIREKKVAEELALRMGLYILQAA